MSTYNKKVFKNPFSFKGRISRTEYNVTGPIIALFFICSVLFHKATYNLSLILIPIAMWLSISQLVKRLHDIGKSGWCVLKFNYTFFDVTLKKGMEGDNQYGSNPSEGD